MSTRSFFYPSTLANLQQNCNFPNISTAVFQKIKNMRCTTEHYTVVEAFVAVPSRN